MSELARDFRTNLLRETLGFSFLRNCIPLCGNAVSNANINPTSRVSRSIDGRKCPTNPTFTCAIRNSNLPYWKSDNNRKFTCVVHVVDPYPKMEFSYRHAKSLFFFLEDLARFETFPFSCKSQYCTYIPDPFTESN